MKKDALIHYLKLYRHDIMNQLQLLQGYLQIDNQAMLREKFQETFEMFKEEQQLFRLHAPHFIIFILYFNHTYENMQLSYTIQVSDIKLEHYDDAIVKQSKLMIEQIAQFRESFMYNWKLDITYRTEEGLIDFIYQLVNNEIDIEKIKKAFRNHTFTFPITVREVDDDLHVAFSVPYK